VVALCRPFLFKSGEARITEEQLYCLDEVAGKLRENPGARLVVDGHSDSDNVSSSFTVGNNAALSLMRAETVRNYLATAGIDWTRLKTRSFGDTCPDQSGDKRFFRRVEIWLLSEGANEASIDELKGCKTIAPTSIDVGLSPDQGILLVSPTSVELVAMAGGERQASFVVLENTGKTRVRILGTHLTGGGSELIVDNLCPGVLEHGRQCFIKVSLYPDETESWGKTYNAIITISDDAFGSPHVIRVNGTRKPMGNEVGWCCRRGGILQATESACNKARDESTFFSPLRDEVERNCQFGFCCIDGKVSTMWQAECTRRVGYFSKDQKQAELSCSSRTQVPDLRGMSVQSAKILIISSLGLHLDAGGAGPNDLITNQAPSARGARHVWDSHPDAGRTAGGCARCARQEDGRCAGHFGQGRTSEFRRDLLNCRQRTITSARLDCRKRNRHHASVREQDSRRSERCNDGRV
jgi:OmpA family protein